MILSFGDWTIIALYFMAVFAVGLRLGARCRVDGQKKPEILTILPAFERIR